MLKVSFLRNLILSGPDGAFAHRLRFVNFETADAAKEACDKFHESARGGRAESRQGSQHTQRIEYSST